MSTKRRRKQTAAASLLQLPDAYLHQFIRHLTPDSKLALRATCKAFLHAVDGTPVHSTEDRSTSSRPSEPFGSCSETKAACTGLRLQLVSRKPSLSALHSLQLLHNVVVLDTQAASRGAISIGCPDPALQLANGLPRLKLAVINNSQASLVDLLVHAAPQLPRIHLSLTSSASKVISQLSQFSNLSTLEVTLDHPAWMKGCSDLGQLTQLQHLVISGKPLDETSKHGVASVSSVFWENNIACLTGLTALHVNPWIKAAPDAGSSVTYSSLRNLRQLHVPYCTGKLGPGATSALLSQLSCCSSLTSLAFGVHEFNWDVSHLSHLTQLRELEIHNPFLKEVWGLQPFTASSLTPLTAATGLTSLTLSHLRLPLLQDTMATAGQGVAAVAAQPGAAAALADALAAGDGPAADIVHAIAATAVAHVLRGAAAGGQTAAAGAAASADERHDSMRAVWWTVADTLQQQAAAAVASAARQLPAAYGARAAAAQAAAAAAAAIMPVAVPTGVHYPSTAAIAAEGSGPPSPGSTVTSSPGTPGVPPEMLALAHEVIAAMAKHTAMRLQQQQQQHLQQQPPDTSRVSDISKQQYLRAAHGMAASVGPVVAAAAAAGAALPTGQIPTYIAVPPPPAQALAAAHLAAQVAGGGNPLAAAALAGPPLGFVAVPAVPPPLLPPPPPPPLPDGQAAAAAVPAVGIPAALPAAGLAAVSAAAADAAAVAASAAAKASASMLFEQVPVLPSLKRLTVGTTHGRLMSGVQIAALAPSLTCLEDLSELPRVPPVMSDILGGLNQLQLLTVNVDTLQLYARHASLTGLRALDKLGNSNDAGGAADGAGKQSKAGSDGTAGRQLRSSRAAAAGADGDGPGSKKGKKGTGKAAAGATKASKAKVSARGSRAAQKQAAAAAANLADQPSGQAADKDTAAGPAAASPAAAAAAAVHMTASDAPVAAAEVAATAAAAAAGPDVQPSTPATATATAPAPAASVVSGPLSSSGGGAVSKYDLLHLGSSWRQLSNLRCLRLLMLGHLQPSDPAADVRVLPTIPGVTRLELCSAFGGSLGYADTYTIAEDPFLWQEQVYVEELVLDGGVLLGGFMVNASMAKLLREKLVRLEKLVLCRCLDLTLEHLETAMQEALVPLIVVKRDCPQVTEANVLELNEMYGHHGVRVELEAVGPTDYVSKSFTYAIDE